MLTGWRPALRLARREVWRAKGRSAVVLGMIGVPVLLFTMLVVLVRTVDAPTPEADALRSLGDADARVTAEGRTPVRQDPAAVETTTDPNPASTDDRPWTASEIERVTGGRTVPVRTGSTLVDSDRGALSASVRELDIRDPAIGDLARLTEGRAPTNAGEVLVSDALVEQGYRPGATIRLDDGPARSLDIVGVVRNPLALNDAELVGLPGSVLPADQADPTYLVDTGGKPVRWTDVREMNELGLVVLSRSVLLDPPAASQPTSNNSYSRLDPYQLMAYAVVVTCIVLEIVLLAGPAFAVGARRQTRQFALLSAAGGAPKDVRLVMLGQGLLLGFGSALIGAVLGVVTLLAGRALVESIAGRELDGFDVRPLDLAVLVGVGTLAALAAAVVPARQAERQHTIAALAGRQAPPRARKGWPVVGGVLLGAGLSLTAYAVGTGNQWYVVFGTLAVVAAAIIATPALLGVVGRLGTRLPLPLRLATRDAARHRSRSASAIAAVMGTVIGVTALGIGSSSDFAESRRDYIPQFANGTLSVEPSFDVDPSRATMTTLTERIERALPGRTVSAVSLTGGESVLVADSATVDRLAAEPLSPDQRRALESGGALVSGNRVPTTDGRVEVGPKEDRTALPTTVFRGLTFRHGGERLATVAITQETADRIGLDPRPSRLYVAPGGPAITEEQRATVEQIALGLGLGEYTEVYVERGFVESYTPILLALIAIGGLIVLAGTATATALALDDARPDLATMGAIGAAPRVRRVQAMAQAAVIGLLGAVLGVLVGAVPGIAITYPLTATAPGLHVVDIPWTLLGVVVLAVPLVAVLGAGLLTRSRLPMVRRIN